MKEAGFYRPFFCLKYSARLEGIVIPEYVLISHGVIFLCLSFGIDTLIVNTINMWKARSEGLIE